MSKWMRIEAGIDANGKLILSDEQKDRLRRFHKHHANKKVEYFIYSEDARIDTGKYHKYYRAALVRPVAQSTGNEEAQVHEEFKRLFAPKVPVQGLFKEELMPQSTAAMTPEEWREFISRVEVFIDEQGLL